MIGDDTKLVRLHRSVVQRLDDLRLPKEPVPDWCKRRPVQRYRKRSYNEMVSLLIEFYNRRKTK